MTDATPATDLSNWRVPPHSRRAFSNVAALLPTAVVANDPARIGALPLASAPLDGFSVPRHGESIGLDAFLESTATDGLVVLHKGRLVFEWYAEGLDAATPHILMSATKSVVGVLAGALQASGELDVERTVESVLPEIGAAWRGATLRQLLDMQTGIVLGTPGEAAYRAATGWDAPADAPADLHRFFERFDGPSQPHGGAFSYVSANTDLLGWVLERLTRRSFAQLLSERLWQPLGAAAPASVTLDARGAARSTGGLSATVRDFARVGQLLVDGGRRNDGVQVVPAEWIDDVATTGDRAAWNAGEFAPYFPGLPMHYRSGWYAIDTEPQTLFAMGIHGQGLFVDRANRLVLAKVSSQAEPTDPAAMGLTLRAFGALRGYLAARG